MSRETRLALARPSIRQGLWWAWLGGGLVYSALFEAPRAVDLAAGISGPAVPALLGWLALAAGVAAYRIGASPRAGALAALGPLLVSGVAPTRLVVAAGLALSGLAGGWVVGGICRRATRDGRAGSAGAGLALTAAAGGVLLVPLSSLWLAAVAGLVVASGLRVERATDSPSLVDPPPVEGLLAADRIAVSFGERVVLNGATLVLRPGELVALVGGNGSGKSTLLRVLSGLLLPDEGSLWLNDVEVTGTSPEALARLGVTLASGSRPVFPDLTVLDNLRIANWFTEGSRRSRAELAADALARFQELAPLSRSSAGTLSGGEQRLLALAASLLARPRVLLADEVTLGLSPAARRTALQTLRNAADSGVAVFIVEHEVRDVLPLADRVLVLEAGRLTETDEPGPTAASFIPEVTT